MAATSSNRNRDVLHYDMLITCYEPALELSRLPRIINAMSKTLQFSIFSTAASSRPILSRMIEFPPKIRVQIFAECLVKTQDPKTRGFLPPLVPGLVPALRAHPKMYEEALEAYYKCNYVMLYPGDYIDFQTVGNTMAKRIRHLVISLP